MQCRYCQVPRAIRAELHRAQLRRPEPSTQVNTPGVAPRNFHMVHPSRCPDRHGYSKVCSEADGRGGGSTSGGNNARGSGVERQFYVGAYSSICSPI